METKDLFHIKQIVFFSQRKHIVWFRKTSFWIFTSYNSNMFISTLGLCLVKCKWEGMWWLYLQQQSLLRSEKLSSVLDTWCVLYLLQNLCHSDLWASPSLMCGTGSCMTMPKQLCMLPSEGGKAAGVAAGTVSRKCKKSANIASGLFHWSLDIGNTFHL